MLGAGVIFGTCGLVGALGYFNRKRALEDLEDLDFLYRQSKHANPPPTTQELRYMQNIHARMSVYAATPKKWFTSFPPHVEWDELPMDESYSKFLKKKQ